MLRNRAFLCEIVRSYLGISNSEYLKVDLALSRTPLLFPAVGRTELFLLMRWRISWLKEVWVWAKETTLHLMVSPIYNCSSKDWAGLYVGNKVWVWYFRKGKAWTLKYGTGQSRISTLPLAGCATLGKLVNFSVPHLLSLTNVDTINSYLLALWGVSPLVIKSLRTGPKKCHISTCWVK